MSDRKVITRGMTIENCECNIVDGPHTHTMHLGPQGYEGPPGPSQYCKDNGHRSHLPAVGKVTNKIEKFMNKTYVTTVGPRGVDGDRGPYSCNEYYHVDNGMLKSSRYVIVIENCKWCDEKEEHDHAVLEGHKGPQGPCYSDI